MSKIERPATKFLRVSRFLIEAEMASIYLPIDNEIRNQIMDEIRQLDTKVRGLQDEYEEKIRRIKHGN